jgi:hypothetical protein
MKTPMQTAFEKLTLAEARALFDFTTDRSKGAAARLWVIESQLAHELKARGAMPSSKDEPYASKAAFQAEIIEGLRINQDGHVAISKREKNAMHKLDNPAFIATARACYGLNPFFGDDAQKATLALDEWFFMSALEAVRAIKAKQTKRRRKAGESKMLLHVEAALRIFIEREKPLEKMTKSDLQEALEKRLGSKVFGVKSESLQEFYKRPEIAPFVTQKRSGGRPKKTGKGRAVEAFDYLPTKKTARG